VFSYRERRFVQDMRKDWLARSDKIVRLDNKLTLRDGEMIEEIYTRAKKMDPSLLMEMGND
jgi:hypothetical protein